MSFPLLMSSCVSAKFWLFCKLASVSGFVCLQMCQNVRWVVEVLPCPTNSEMSAGRVAANVYRLAAVLEFYKCQPGNSSRLKNQSTNFILLFICVRLAETAADSEQKDEDIFVSQHSSKPLVTGRR